MAQPSNADEQKDHSDFDAETGELNLWCEPKTFAKVRQFINSEFPDIADVPADEINSIVIEDLSKMPPPVSETEEAVVGFIGFGGCIFLALSALLGMAVMIAWLAGYFSR